ncbi:hypothetical protein D3C72_2140420 [compost metagenome]
MVAPHLARPHEIGNGRVKPGKARIHHIVTAIAEQGCELAVAVADDTMRGIDHGHGNVGQGELQLCRHVVEIRLTLPHRQDLAFAQ